ncbi:MAG TPA: SIS domain-containing protein [Firmicutes bacterium]|nr:SIS domain-containing protein [Bacillota bacterium]
MNAFERYTEQVRGVLDKVQKTQAVQIDKAAEAVANAVAQDGLVHTFGTGHSHMVAEEIVYRAGSLAPVNAILEPSLTGDQQVTKSEYTERMEGWGEIIVDYQQVSTKDVMIVISNSGRNAAPIEVAWECQKRGVPVIAILSKDYGQQVTSRHSSGKKLMDVADIVIDNCSELGDAALHLDGLDIPVGPTSNVSAFYIINAIVVSAVEKLIAKGVEPPVFLSGNLDHGRERNDKLIEKYRSRIGIL